MGEDPGKPGHAHVFLFIVLGQKERHRSSSTKKPLCQSCIASLVREESSGCSDFFFFSFLASVRGELATTFQLDDDRHENSLNCSLPSATYASSSLIN